MNLPPPEFPRDLAGMPHLEDHDTSAWVWLFIAFGSALAVAVTLIYVLAATT